MMRFAGYTFIVQELGLSLPPLGLELAQGNKSQDEIKPYGLVKIKILSKSRKVGGDIYENLETAINYQGIRLSHLVPIFERIDAVGLTNFIKDRPQSSVRRCIWYLFEWLMSRRLDIENSTANYIPLLDDRFYYVSSTGIKDSRTRVINNFLGNKNFCPIVRKTTEVKSIADKNVMDMALTKLVATYSPINPGQLGRSIEYLYTKETKSSTQIENEDPSNDKMRKFYRVLKTSGSIPLTKRRLVGIQNEIVRNNRKDNDYRKEEIYVGETRITWHDGIEENIHYIGPKWEQVPSMMDGLLEMHQAILLDNSLSPLIHAAIMSFGFVYIHPFSDGNGRIHRYLIHDILKSRMSNVHDFIIPVSAAILQRAKEYDEILEKISRPIMAMIDYDLNEDDHSIRILNDIHFMYRYPDLTEHVVFLYRMMEASIIEDLTQEVLYIVKYDAIKKAIEEKFDMPNKELNLFIQLSLHNNGKVANKKRKRFEKWINEEQMQELEKVLHGLLEDIAASEGKA